jgi:thioredoxin
MTEKNFQELKQLQEEGKKILLDVFATWCGPCKVLGPKLEKIESEYPNVVFVKMDVQKNMEFAQEMGINSVPTVMIYNGKDLVSRIGGLRDDSSYKEVLDTL